MLKRFMSAPHVEKSILMITTQSIVASQLRYIGAVIATNGIFGSEVRLYVAQKTITKMVKQNENIRSI